MVVDAVYLNINLTINKKLKLLITVQHGDQVLNIPGKPGTSTVPVRVPPPTATPSSLSPLTQVVIK